MIKIQKHEDLSSQSWFGTSKDSQMFFSYTWYEMPKNILDKYFEVGNNGGSYSINFNSEDLNEIIEELVLTDIHFVQVDNTKTIPRDLPCTKSDYLEYQIEQTRDGYTEMLAPLFASAF